ncbi:uncharacterized protein [Blastocystis hominis]|uniref:RRM domain-containing protein n=1 Tax=Blastocystis hominis TaxID=12968 RepID=D8LWQ2_BLAHO|nr:uncharacterized protein [Blastocystis hominis]CBK20241.2 unnamed protein product [Blastocystis hominis]|eukprot:XP_012894289.1 uncharacterized protein [Blastocystis hominis]
MFRSSVNLDFELVTCREDYHRSILFFFACLFRRNLPYKITNEEIYDIFAKYGDIRQIRVGETKETRGTAFVVYEDIYDAKDAVDHLSGFNVGGRYLVVLYFQATRWWL